MFPKTHLFSLKIEDFWHFLLLLNELLRLMQLMVPFSSRPVDFLHIKQVLTKTFVRQRINDRRAKTEWCGREEGAKTINCWNAGHTTVPVASWGPNSRPLNVMQSAKTGQEINCWTDGQSGQNMPSWLSNENSASCSPKLQLKTTVPFWLVSSRRRCSRTRKQKSCLFGFWAIQRLHSKGSMPSWVKKKRSAPTLSSLLRTSS